jgi:hypothetical protein
MQHIHATSELSELDLEIIVSGLEKPGGLGGLVIGMAAGEMIRSGYKSIPNIPIRNAGSKNGTHRSGALVDKPR